MYANNHSAFFVGAGEKLGGDCMDNMARNYGSLDQGRSAKSNKKQSNSGHILKIEQQHFLMDSLWGMWGAREES